MIAIGSSHEVGWNGTPTVPERTGSLRRIDEVLGELLAGYALAGPVAAVPESKTEEPFVAIPPLEDLGDRLSPVEMIFGLPAVERGQPKYEWTRRVDFLW